jgi:hypothetical protein
VDGKKIGFPWRKPDPVEERSEKMKKLHWLPLSLFSLASYTPKPFLKFQKKINYQRKPIDTTVDGSVGIGDMVCFLNYLYQAGSLPIPPEAGDVNCCGNIDLKDVLHL